ncbi:helix-turn-helix transcriptional regulator [Streptomyces sp. NPDC056987]|uniref:helix-turn-helix transcriptional regulator n=1 Tax=Streptomyces sp. NPDC056987 TaxID=3345988 RepID=UPI003638EAB0
MSSSELSEFLRARRGRIQPADVGLPTYGRRRVPGLRREEVALLAGVSTDYYTKLEQGHGSGVSDSVLDAVADVLRLDPTERAHLRRLVRPAGPRRARRPAAPVRPGLLRLLDLMPDIPAVLVGPSFNPLAWNSLADALFDITDADRTGTGYAKQIFLDPAARLMYPEWESVATEVVGYLRFNAGRDPDDTTIGALVGELSIKSPEFRSLWSRQTVRDKTHGRKLIHHHAVGTLELDYEAFRLPEDNRQALMTYTPEAGSASEDRLRLLASWAASAADAPPAAESASHAADDPPPTS